MAEKEEQLQKLYLEFQLLDQQIKQLEKQSIALNNQVAELTITGQSLEDMENIKAGTEILVPLSSGIFTKAELKDNKKFIVNVGSSVAVVKDAESTKKLIASQVDEIKKFQESLAKQLESHNAKALSLEQEINRIASTIKEK